MGAITFRTISNISQKCIAEFFACKLKKHDFGVFLCKKFLLWQFSRVIVRLRLTLTAVSIISYTDKKPLIFLWSLLLIDCVNTACNLERRCKIWLFVTWDWLDLISFIAFFNQEGYVSFDVSSLIMLKHPSHLIVGRYWDNCVMLEW